MITSSDSAVTIMADAPTTILTIDHRTLKEVLLGHADICYRLMQTMARSIFSLTSELERASFQTVQQRLVGQLPAVCGHEQCHPKPAA